jgi:hypothetical protein
MAFLDNSGDIILDAVLTDAGRSLLARGDGSFRITKFALGDDEIDYSLYDRDNPSGSAYYDLNILQTPVLEAFADNAASMKSKLLSIPRNNLLYLPVLKLAEVFSPNTAMHPSGAFMVAVDRETEDALSINGTQNVQGIILGETMKGGSYIRIDQGLDTDEITPNIAIDSDLVETQFIVEMDNRLGKIASRRNSRTARVSYVDDDNIASYFLSLGTDLDYVMENTARDRVSTQTIRGPRGTSLEFTIQSSLELNSSTYLFELLGGTTTMQPNNTPVRKLDTIVRVTGATTGARVDIPVRFVKLV